jgi:hypothetical protein
MFRIERKIVHVGTEKIITLYLRYVYVESDNFSFTFNDAEDYAASEKWQKNQYLFNLLHQYQGSA